MFQRLDAIAASFKSPESKLEHFNCPIHGQMIYRTYARENGRFLPPYCPACREAQDAMDAISQKIGRESKAQASAICNALGLHRQLDQREYRFDNFVAETEDAQKVLREVQKFAENFLNREAKRQEAREAGLPGWNRINSWGLFFQGNPGTGKTHLCHAVMNALEAQGIGAVYVSLFDLFQALKLYGRSDESGLFKLLAKVPVLILDEFGRSALTDFEKTRLWRIIDSRMNYGRPMIIVTNAGKEDIRAVVDQSILDRFKDCLIPEVFSWESRRGKVRPTADEVF